MAHPAGDGQCTGSGINPFGSLGFRYSRKQVNEKTFIFTDRSLLSRCTNKMTLIEYLLLDAIKDIKAPITDQEFQDMLRKVESEAHGQGRPVKPHRSGGGQWVGTTTIK